MKPSARRHRVLHMHNCNRKTVISRWYKQVLWLFRSIETKTSRIGGFINNGINSLYFGFFEPLTITFKFWNMKISTAQSAHQSEMSVPTTNTPLNWSRPTMVVKIKVALLSPACNYDIVQYTARYSENCAAHKADQLRDTCNPARMAVGSIYCPAIGCLVKNQLITLQHTSA